VAVGLCAGPSHPLAQEALPALFESLALRCEMRDQLDLAVQAMQLRCVCGCRCVFVVCVCVCG
jgi:hypothetical protein